MMGPLANPRHERFCQALFEGKPASTAYAEAGYSPHDGNCIRLRGNERVKARLAELQEAVARKSEVTVESLLDELEHARQRADSLDQLGAAVKAISEKAKISGLLTTKIEITDNTGESMDDWVDAMLAGPGSPIGQFHPVDAKDRQGLINLVQRAACEISEYLDAIRARPVCAERVDPKRLPTDWQSLRLHSAVPPRRIGNGSR
jgi:phage terminase small subunit